MKLQKKATLFLFLPTFLVLTAMGGIGFYLVRGALLNQWQETAIEKLNSQVDRTVFFLCFRLISLDKRLSDQLIGTVLEKHVTF